MFTAKEIKLLLFGAGLVAALGGCSNVKKGKTGKPAVEEKKNGDALVKINGVIELTASEFQRELAMTGGGSFAAMLLPPSVQRKILDSFVDSKLTAIAASRAGIERDKEFKEVFAEQVSRLKDNLLIAFYRKKLLDEAKVSEDEIKAEYEKNKERYVQKAGGTLTVAVEFNKKENAESFLRKVRSASKDDFVKQAKEEKEGVYREFGFVPDNEQTPSIAPVEIVKAVKKAPLGKPFIVEAGGTYWVVLPEKHRDTVYFPLKEIHDVIAQHLKEKKIVGELKKKIEELKKEMKIEINEDYFKQMEESQRQMQQMQQMMAKQQTSGDEKGEAKSKGKKEDADKK